MVSPYDMTYWKITGDPPLVKHTTAVKLWRWWQVSII